jgi:hypothetical protein
VEGSCGEVGSIGIQNTFFSKKKMVSEYACWLLLRDFLPPELTNRVYFWLLKAWRKYVKEKVHFLLRSSYPRKMYRDLVFNGQLEHSRTWYHSTTLFTPQLHLYSRRVKVFQNRTYIITILGTFRQGPDDCIIHRE